MLAGIEVDTNSYGIKTTAKTFRASAFLLEMGAVNFLKYDILKEDKKEYLKREKHLEKSYIVFNKFAICKIEKKIAKEDLSVIAEKMLTFDQVEAAFAIGKIEKNGVAISARSLGETNVYQIMKEFDGGGHFTEAATQIKNQDLDKIEKQLIKKLEVIK